MVAIVLFPFGFSKFSDDERTENERSTKIDWLGGFVNNASIGSKRVKSSLLVCISASAG